VEYGGRSFSARLFSGVVNHQNLDPVLLSISSIEHPRGVRLDVEGDDDVDGGAGRSFSWVPSYMDDSSDWIHGGSLGFGSASDGHGLELYALAAHAVPLSSGAAPQVKSLDNRSTRRWQLAGLLVERDLGGCAAVAEGAIGRRLGDSASGEEPAVAGYGQAACSHGGVDNTIEVKAYRHWRIGRDEPQIAFNDPPTLERFDQDVAGNEDAAGIRLRSQWRFMEAASIYGSAMAYRYGDRGEDPFGASAKLALHGYAGAQFSGWGGADAEISAGYRTNRRPEGEGGGAVLSLWHLDLSASAALGSDLAVTAKLNHVSEDKALVTQTLGFHRGLGVMSVSLWRRVVLSGLLGYTTERPVAPTWYPAFEASLKLLNGSEVTGFVGRLAGGRVCAGGTCRELPPFEGIRVDAVFRY